MRLRIGVFWIGPSKCIVQVHVQALARSPVALFLSMAPVAACHPPLPPPAEPGRQLGPPKCNPVGCSPSLHYNTPIQTHIHPSIYTRPSQPNIQSPSARCAYPLVSHSRPPQPFGSCILSAQVASSIRSRMPPIIHRRQPRQSRAPVPGPRSPPPKPLLVTRTSLH